MNTEDKKYFEKLVVDLQKKSEEKTERYIGAMMENHQHTLDAISENTKDIPKMKEMIDIMFENMGKQEGDIEMLKDAYQNHEERLQKVESKR